MQKTKQQYLQAANQYIETIKHNPDIIGIIIAGGFLNGMIHKNSDVDLCIILKETCDYFKRGVVWINDIEVEYFMNPPRLFRKQFEQECFIPVTANILDQGIVTYQSSKEVEKLIQEARLHLKAELPPMRDSKKRIMNHKLDDRYKDLEDLIIIKDFFGAQLIRNEFVNYCVDLFFRIHQLKKDKFKRIQALIDAVDKNFTKHIDACLQSNIEDLEKALFLKSYIEELLGGANPRNWNIRGNAKQETLQKV